MEEREPERAEERAILDVDRGVTILRYYEEGSCWSVGRLEGGI